MSLRKNCNEEIEHQYGGEHDVRKPGDPNAIDNGLPLLTELSPVFVEWDLEVTHGISQPLDELVAVHPQTLIIVLGNHRALHQSYHGEEHTQ